VPYFLRLFQFFYSLHLSVEYTQTDGRTDGRTKPVLRLIRTAAYTKLYLPIKTVNNITET